MIGLGLGIGFANMSARRGEVEMNRVRVFVDFWNFHLSVHAMMRLPIEISWEQLGLRAAQALAQMPYVNLGGSIRCEGVHIYGSYLTSDKWQHDSAKKMQNEIALLAGVFPVFEVREKARSVKTCPECGHKIRLSPEEGIDVRLAVDMIKLSNAEPDTIIMLAANDSDFVPLADYLTSIGRRLVHLRPEKGNKELSKKCWANVALETIDRGAFPFSNGTMVIKLNEGEETNPLVEVLRKHGLEATVLRSFSESLLTIRTTVAISSLRFLATTTKAT